MVIEKEKKMLKYRFLLAVLPLFLLVGCSGKKGQHMLAELIVFGTISAIGGLLSFLCKIFTK